MSEKLYWKLGGGDFKVETGQTATRLALNMESLDPPLYSCSRTHKRIPIRIPVGLGNWDFGILFRFSGHLYWLGMIQGDHPQVHPLTVHIETSWNCDTILTVRRSHKILVKVQIGLSFPFSIWLWTGLNFQLGPGLWFVNFDQYDKMMIEKYQIQISILRLAKCFHDNSFWIKSL